MIISIHRQGESKPQQYTYRGDKVQVVLGRNPKCEDDSQIITVDEGSASRTHLAIKMRRNRIKVMDLGSSNGTTVNGRPVEPNQWIGIQFGDEVVLGQMDGKIVVKERPKEKEQAHNKEESSSESKSRSRQKKSKTKFQDLCKQLKISDSTLKMLKQMSSEKKSQEQRIKFLKLMGCRKVQDNWQEIKQHLKKQNKFTDSNKKASAELQKQFDSGRAAFEKKGLGSR